MDLTTPWLMVSDFRIKFGLFYVFWVDFYVLQEYWLRTSDRYHPVSVTEISSFSEDLPVAHIMTTKEISRYLKLHEITISKYAAAGIIPASRIGRIWRFDKDVIDDWIKKGQNEQEDDERPKRKGVLKKPGKKKSKLRKV